MYDLLEGVDKVKVIYYFLIVTDKGADAVFELFYKAILDAKLADSKKYTCTLAKEQEQSFL